MWISVSRRGAERRGSFCQNRSEATLADECGSSRSLRRAGARARPAGGRGPSRPSRRRGAGTAWSTCRQTTRSNASLVERQREGVGRPGSVARPPNGAHRARAPARGGAHQIDADDPRARVHLGQPRGDLAGAAAEVEDRSRAERWRAKIADSCGQIASACARGCAPSTRPPFPSPAGCWTRFCSGRSVIVRS